MAIETDSLIIDALLTHVDAFELPLGVRCYKPGKSETRDLANPYILVQFFANQPDQPFISLTREPIRMGLLQLDVYWPKNQGVIEAYELAGALVRHFPRGPNVIKGTTTVWVLGRNPQAPYVASPIQEPDWLHLPVVIPWTHYP